MLPVMEMEKPAGLAGPGASRVEIELPSATAGPGETLHGGRKALAQWIYSQRVNAARGLFLLRDYGEAEFGTTAASPSPAHVHASNRLVQQLRAILLANVKQVSTAAAAALARPGRAELDRLARLKDENGNIVSETEKIWNYYWTIFNQRLTKVAPRLLAADRIALDCYQYVYQGLGRPRSIPSPPPLCYLEAGLGPATYRRGVKLASLGHFPNPFPLVKLPDHRLICPWTLGAIPHEVAHNLQADLGLWDAVPEVLRRLLREAGISKESAETWVRWQKEIFADLLAVLLTGPSYIGSLMDVVGKSPVLTTAWNPGGVHPTPFLRVLINIELVRRLGFTAEARNLRAAWLGLYPPERAHPIPQAMRRQFALAVRRTVDAICETPYAQLGNRSLRQVVAFRPQDQVVAVEAAYRLARNADPGIVPERFLLAAVRYAFDHRLASPDVLARNFYETLGRR